MDLAYVAHSERCVLLLDAEGVCRWFVPKADAGERSIATAKRCVGAQFVASLDPDLEGLLGHEPRVGTNLLFAVVTDGRVALVRFGPLLSFEVLDEVRARSIAESIEEQVADEASSHSVLEDPDASIHNLIARIATPAEASSPVEPRLASFPSTPDLGDLGDPESTGEYVVDDASDVEIVTGSFARVTSPMVDAVLRELESSRDVGSEIELSTGSFARVSTDNVPELLWGEDDVALEVTPPRGTGAASRHESGIVARHPGETSDAHMIRAIGGIIDDAARSEPSPRRTLSYEDDETRRFAHGVGESLLERAFALPSNDGVMPAERETRPRRFAH